MNSVLFKAFKKTLKHTLRFEGGYVHDPDDSGGETFQGVSRKSFPNWPGWKRIDQAKAGGATTALLINAFFDNDGEMAGLVADLYRENFWEPLLCLGASGRVLSKLFDTAVNVGMNRAVKMVQSVINQMGLEAPLVVDGCPGPKTQTGFAEIMDDPDDDHLFLSRFVLFQESHYRRLAEKKPSQEKFIRGWLRRAWWLPD